MTPTKRRAPARLRRKPAGDKHVVGEMPPADAAAPQDEADLVNRGFVLERLASNAKRAMKSEAVRLRGEPTGEYRYDGAVANRALELIGKELGMFGEKPDNTLVRYVISDRPLTPEEWEAQYAGGDKDQDKSEDK